MTYIHTIISILKAAGPTIGQIAVSRFSSQSGEVERLREENEMLKNMINEMRMASQKASCSLALLLFLSIILNVFFIVKFYIR